MGSTPKFTPATNFQGAGTTEDSTYSNFGLTVYKNYETQLNRDMYLNEHITSMVEMANGAHYYAHGAYCANYTKAEATVDLSKITVDTKGRRVACISLSMMGAYGTCDMGIEKIDGDWFGMCYSKAAGQAKSNAPVSGAATVTITLAPTKSNGQDVITGTYVWKNSAGTTICTESLTVSCAENTLFTMSGSVPLVRFMRFMSLILRDEIEKTPSNDYADGSKLTGGNFSSPKLYKADGSSVVWNKALMDYIWSVQGWNISALSVDTADSFSCAHSHNVYNSNTSEGGSNSGDTSDGLPRVVPSIGDFVQLTAMLGGADQIAAGPIDGAFEENSLLYKIAPCLWNCPSITANNITPATVAQDFEVILGVDAAVVFGPIDSDVADTLMELAREQEMNLKAKIIGQFSTPVELMSAFTAIGDILEGNAQPSAANFNCYYACQMDKADAVAQEAREYGAAAPNVLYVSEARDEDTVFPTDDICHAYMKLAGVVDIGAEMWARGYSDSHTITLNELNRVDEFIAAEDMQLDFIIVEDVKMVESIKDFSNPFHAEILVCPKAVYKWSGCSGEGALFPLWLVSFCYSEFDSGINMTAEVNAFLSDWYGYDASSEEIEAILAGTISEYLASR
ncbi:MAG: hypothetical protein LUG13_06020 [Oscillospiraceae bacterium]|nr:hypothetical protein [Oscillospiraceae bacterium]